MSESKHTKETWEREWEQDGEYTGPGDNPPGYAGDHYETNDICYVNQETGEVFPIALFEREQDVLRAIACVNACAGINPEAVPDLLAVVEELLESAEYWSEWDVPIGIVDRMKEAVKKARE